MLLHPLDSLVSFPPHYHRHHFTLCLYRFISLQELSGVMLRAKHQMAQGDHYGATRSLTILRQECYNNNNHNNNHNSNNNHNNNSGSGTIPPSPMLPDVLRSRLEHWLAASIDTLLLQIKREVGSFLKSGLHSAGLVGDTMLRRQAQTSIQTLLHATNPITTQQQQQPTIHTQPQPLPLGPLPEPQATSVASAAPTKTVKTKIGRQPSSSTSSSSSLAGPDQGGGGGGGMSLSLLSVLHMVRTHCTTSAGGSNSVISPKAATAASIATMASMMMPYDGVAALSTYFLWLEAGDLAIATVPTQASASSGSSSGGVSAGSSDTSAGVGVENSTIVPVYFLQVKIYNITITITHNSKVTLAITIPLTLALALVFPAGD